MANTKLNKSTYQPKNDSDALNPLFTFQQTNQDLLVAMLNGQLDPMEMIKAELKSRGLDENGKWVGFKK